VLRRLSTVTSVQVVASRRVTSQTAAIARPSAPPQLALPFDVDPQRAPTEPASADPEPTRPEFVWASRTAAHVGTVVHRHLQRIAESGLDFEGAASIERRASTYAQELRLLGVEEADVAAGAARVIAALHSALEDPHGRFVLGAHEDARSELTLTLRSGDALEHIRLDRTFVADGERWIVDFKTSRHEGGDRAAFLDSEVERYRPQLDRYAAALAAIEGRKVRVALYFPLLKELRAWPAG
jgi:ATP-dependent exoDNAse (exonuclease V) beta subunit